MPNPPSPRTTRVLLEAHGSGLAVGFCVSVVAPFVGTAVGDVFGGLISVYISNLGFAGLLLCSLISVGVVAFLLSFAAGYGIGGSEFRSPLAFALGVGGLPLIGSVLFLYATFPDPDLEIICSLMGLGVVQTWGSHIGCRQQPIPQPQLGIGHTCANCNYDLTATADHKPCPECGHMFRLAPPDSATSTNQPPPGPPN
jgi:hypothetical protein